MSGEEGVMKAWGLLAAGIIVVGAALVTVGAQVQSQPYSGSGDYQVYCSSCHGPDAKGDGVIAKSLRKHPADLTQLTKKNDGEFPTEKVFKTIDGSKGGGHADEMPAWGDVFAKSSESAGAENAAARIDVLVKYIQSLQAK
jgi:mono/diheme cytochrome c family protein